ncbi:MAG: hypothetical protein HUK21_10730, partial [Fibrobacteraceae bacterium]|nr:hypothetical protein [Fibrobacteraceae bacterium]
MNPKKSFRKFLTLALGAAPLLCALVLTACGEDSTSVKDKDPSAASIDEVEIKGELPKCNSWREGVRYYVADEDADYLCENNKWKNLNADDDSDADGDDDSSDDGSKDSEKDDDNNDKDSGKSSSSTKKSSSSKNEDSSDSGNSSSSVKGDSDDD